MHRKSVQEWEKKSDVLHKVVKKSSTFRLQGGGRKIKFHDRWKEGELNLCMTSKELFPIVIASSLWGHLWKGKRLLVHCDNEGAVKA